MRAAWLAAAQVGWRQPSGAAFTRRSLRPACCAPNYPSTYMHQRAQKLRVVGQSGDEARVNAVQDGGACSGQGAVASGGSMALHARVRRLREQTAGNAHWAPERCILHPLRSLTVFHALLVAANHVCYVPTRRGVPFGRPQLHRGVQHTGRLGAWLGSPPPRRRAAAAARLRQPAQQAGVNQPTLMVLSMPDVASTGRCGWGCTALATSSSAMMTLHTGGGSTARRMGAVGGRSTGMYGTTCKARPARRPEHRHARQGEEEQGGHWQAWPAYPTPPHPTPPHPTSPHPTPPHPTPPHPTPPHPTPPHPTPPHPTAHGEGPSASAACPLTARTPRWLLRR